MDEIGGDPGARFGSGSLPDLLDMGDRLIARAGAKSPLLNRLLAHYPLTSRGLLLAFVGLLLLLVLPPLVVWLLRRFGHLQTNFRQERIPQSYGLVILLWTVPMLALAGMLFPAARPERWLWLWAVLGFGALGLSDDLWGDKRIKGLRGHFRAAFHQRTLTTGFVKAVGGGLLALWIGHLAEPENLPAALLAALLIALAANAINLLDLRPGRAGAVFLVASGLLLAYSVWNGARGVPSLLYVVLPTLPVYERDARAKVMLGDVGSNLLGACLGLGVATLLPVAAQLTVLLLLIGLHVVAECLSLTALIEKQPLLRALDRLTGER
ncbi:MAG TPA: hypothetical protein VFB21_15425 [Chthonomonadaceae bacterium]|nr:hypothetical protein [Chthonomonadaceae bacterium]